MSLEESTGSAEMSTTITEVSSIGAEVPKVVEEDNEIVDPQSNTEVSNEIEGQEALVEETSTDVKVDNAVLQDVPENEEIEKPPNQDTKSATDTLQLESLSSQEQSPVSTEALNTRSVGEMSEDVEIGTRSVIGVEEPVISTYQERKGPLYDAAQELPPIDEDEIILTYENKTQNEIVEEQHVQEEPIALYSKKKREDLLLSEITFREEPVTETEPELSKNEDKMKTDEVRGEGQVEEPFEVQMGEPSDEEPLIPTYRQSKRENTEDEEEGEAQEVLVNEEAMVFSYPDRYEDPIRNESQDGPKMDEEEPVVLEIDEKKEKQIQEQIQEFLKLDASIDENSGQKSKAAKNDHEVDGISTRDTPKENELPKAQKIIDEHSEKSWDKSSPFDKKSTFSTSTPKKELVEQGARDAENKKQKTIPPISYNVTRFKQESVMLIHCKVQMVNNIRDVKLSTKVLMAQLAEMNKKLRMLQKELLAVQKSTGDDDGVIVNLNLE